MDWTPTPAFERELQGLLVIVFVFDCYLAEGSMSSVET